MSLRYLGITGAVFTVFAFGCTKPEQDSVGSNAADSKALSKPATPDAKIESMVKGKFIADSELKNEKIQVSVKDGRVTLTGEVSSDAVRIKAEDTARSVDDVFGVDAEKLVSK